MNNETPDWVTDQLMEEDFLQSHLTVSDAEYGDAVLHLMKLANMPDTKGNLAAAQVLLSLYNGYDWHVNLCNLCLLDQGYFQSALIAIRGRVVLSREPQYFIDNGNAVFLALWDKWIHLHVSQRYNPLSVCPKDQMLGYKSHQSQLGVTELDYTNAVLHLVELVNMSGTSGSQVGAQVLLSLYDGTEWHVDLTDFCLLDLKYFQSVLIAIQGRVLLNREPQHFTNGDTVFRALRSEWMHLHVSQRYKD